MVGARIQRITQLRKDYPFNMSDDDYDKLLKEVLKTMRKYAIPRRAFARQLYAIMDDKEVQEISAVKHNNVVRWTTKQTTPNGRATLAMQEWLKRNP